MTAPVERDLFGKEIHVKKSKAKKRTPYEKKPPVKRLGEGVWVAYSKNIPGAEGLFLDSHVGPFLAEVYIVKGRAIVLRRRAK